MKYTLLATAALMFMAIAAMADGVQEGLDDPEVTPPATCRILGGLLPCSENRKHIHSESKPRPAPRPAPVDPSQETRC